MPKTGPEIASAIVAILAAIGLLALARAKGGKNGKG